VEQRINALVQDFRRDGFVLVPGDYSSEHLREFVAEFDTECTVDEPSATFPFRSLALNRLLFERNVATVMKAIFGGSCVTLGGVTALRKLGGTRRFDQPLHLEYSSSTLLVPRDADDLRGVVVIRYLSDVPSPAQGPTAVLPREHAAGIDIRTTRSISRKSEAAGLYEDEHLVRAKAGDALVFGFNTFHRATEVAEGEERLSIVAVYTPRRAAEEGRYPPSSFTMEQWPRVRELIAGLDAEERVLLGFPPADDSYWNDETIAAVLGRYPGMSWSRRLSANRAPA
jgi:hypothetical protein